MPFADEPASAGEINIPRYRLASAKKKLLSTNTL
jgi:hypothetical protein